ncbi:RNA polymerase Rpc34 subunit-domain-containing protein [Auriculariales sp. MPI-PUGE-AT-0066]|nr:RNA polymerase Rpc34 subunit-domain-containing protein [Auriculariales sp. MPI-PUGE-AT-0066]
MSRALNAVERRIHEEAASKPNKIISQKEVDALTPDSKARMEALNFLLKTGMFTAMRETSGGMAYKANTKNEMAVKKDLSQDEALIMSAISAAKNEGIWTKHLKTKTELHQTVLNRCLKTLEQKGYIKPIKSVKFPTRKLFMLSHLEPSVEVTGGPWYTDQEFDTSFIQALLSACHQFIMAQTLPKDHDSDARPLYAISHAPKYPSAASVQAFLKKSRLTETDLQAEHVESLLNVLVYDGLVERLPAYGSAAWNVGDSEDSDGEGAGGAKRRKGKAKGKGKAGAGGKGRKRKRSRSESEEEDSSEEERRKKKKRKARESEEESSGEDTRKKKRSKAKSKSKDGNSNSENDSESDERVLSKKAKKKSSSSSKRRRDESSDESDSEDSDERSARSKKKKRKRSKARASSSEDDSADSDSEDDVPARKVPAFVGEGFVYRAVRQETIGQLQGWSQAPCCGCPQFEFCSDRGPVNPQGCEYFATSTYHSKSTEI